MPVYNLITFGSVALSCVYTGFNDTRHSGGTASRVNASTLLALHSMTTSNVLKHRVYCVRVADNFSLRILWCNNCTHCTVIWQRCTDAPTRRCRTITFMGGSRGVTRVTSHPPGAAAYFMLLLCLWLKLFRCRFVPLLEPNPDDATAPRSYVQLVIILNNTTILSWIIHALNNALNNSCIKETTS